MIIPRPRGRKKEIENRTEPDRTYRLSKGIKTNFKAIPVQYSNESKIAASFGSKGQFDFPSPVAKPTLTVPPIPRIITNMSYRRKKTTGVKKKATNAATSTILAPCPKDTMHGPNSRRMRTYESITITTESSNARN